MASLILYFVISHIISFTCSLLESVLLTCTPAYVALLKKKGAKGASQLDEMKRRIDRPLAAILALNTIAHTFGAAGVGAGVVHVFGEKWLALGSVILTLTMLYWTEMLPKVIGATYWKSLVPHFIRPLQVLIWFTYPVVMSFNYCARLLSGGRHDKISEDDIRVALEAGAEAGVIEEEEQEMVENIFRLGDRRVGMLMSPRVDIDWIDLHDHDSQIRENILSLGKEQYVVCDEEIDRVVGIVQTRQLLAQAWRKEAFDLRGLVEPALFVNENTQVFELLDIFKKKRKSIALVTDEYGTIQGVIRLSDVMNAITKDIDLQESGESSPIRKINNRSWIIEGKMPIDEFKEIFHFERLPHEEKARYRTLSGLCMTMIGAVPKKGDAFVVGSHRFEVISVRKMRVEKVLMTFR
ncbi:MAG: HlyC/CorC family transporter [Chlamydiales bacterium]|nr:HlyC/CorC family transporter [Chlamydiales bacterium]